MIVVAAGEEKPYGKEEGCQERPAVSSVTCWNHLFGGLKPGPLDPDIYFASSGV
jgi:hypothetical protein